MLASHVVGCPPHADLTSCRADPRDARLLERYAHELRGQPSTVPWLLLYREGYDRFTRVQLSQPGSVPCLSCAGGTTIWGERAVWRRFPRLEEAVRTHPHIQEEEPYLRRYYWFHSSLLLWLEEFAHCFPKVKHVWRVEPDVLFTGTIDQLVSLSDNEHADVLLADVHMGVNGSMLSTANNYNHFAFQTFLDRIPPERIAWSLVSIGRYSATFLRHHMASRWAEGMAGYEEILLPTSCLSSSHCRLAAFNGWESVSANHVVFRVNHYGEKPRYWHCSEYLEALNTKDGTLELWHPVKDRSCLTIEADGTDGGTERHCTVCPVAAAPASSADVATSLRSLRRRSVAWSDRFRDREMRERPFQAQRRERDLAKLAELQRTIQLQLPGAGRVRVSQ